MGRETRLVARCGCLAAVLLAAGVVGGCDSGSDDGGTPQRKVEAGVEAVRHGGLGDYERPAFTVEHLLAIGQEGGAPEYTFGSVAGIDVMSDGTIAVLDGLAGEVRTFAPDGSFVRRIGRRGEGPGEISGEAALALVAVAPREFLLPDIMTQALNVFSLDGEVVRTARFDIQQLYIPEWRTTDDLQPVVRVSTPGAEVVAHYSLVGAKGALADTLAVAARAASLEASDGQQPLWQDHLVWSFDKPDLVVSGWMFTPQFAVHRGGEVVRTVSWDHVAARLTPEEQEAVLGIVASGMGTDAASMPDAFRAQLRLPEQLPAMADIEVAGDLVLVQRVRPVEAMDLRVIYTFKAAGFGDRIWDVFSLDGDYLGELDLGARADVFDIRGDTVVGVREDDAGLQQVFLARLPRRLP